MRSVSVGDENRIRAAVARGALTPARAEHWRAFAAAGHDVTFIDQLVGGVVLPMATTVAASAAPRNADAEYPEYRALFGPAEAGQQIADDREVAARAAVAALTDDQVYENMFGKASSASAPVTASAAGPAGQHGRAVAGPQYRVHAPRVSLRVPRSPDGLAAGADPCKTSWSTIDLYGGDLVPEDAHPDDIARLLHQKNRLGPLIKPW